MVYLMTTTESSGNPPYSIQSYSCRRPKRRQECESAGGVVGLVSLALRGWQPTQCLLHLGTLARSRCGLGRLLPNLTDVGSSFQPHTSRELGEASAEHYCASISAKPAARASDALIAASAIAPGVPLYTCNPADFTAIPRLKLR